MDKIIPWGHWVDLIAPYYPSGKRGRPPKGIETTLLHFRHLLEENGIGEQMDVAARLDAAGLMMHGGSIVAIKSAPSSTKNREKKRDSEMHQTKKETSGILG